jgi:hypothetical protein
MPNYVVVKDDKNQEKVKYYKKVKKSDKTAPKVSANITKKCEGGNKSVKFDLS